MKNNLIKSLLMSSLILGGVWNHEVAYSSEDASRVIDPYDVVSLSSNRGVTRERAEEILMRFAKPFKVYKIDSQSEEDTDSESEEDIDRRSKEVIEEWTKAKLLPVCSEKEFVNITIKAHKLEASPDSRAYEHIYNLYRKGFLGEVSNKQGLYITEWCKKLTKEVIKQIYGIYDLLKHRVLNVVNEDDITEDDYLKIYQRSAYDYPDSREERDCKLEEDIEKLKKKDETEIKNIVEECKGRYHEYQSLFYNTSSNLKARIELLDYYWRQDCSAFDELNDLLVEMVKNSRFFDKEYYGDWKKESNVVFDIRLKIYDFFNIYSFENEYIFSTICEEVEQEYKPKDDLVLAYCNYHFSTENTNLQLSLQYFEDASLSNPIFIRDIMQYVKLLSSSYHYFNDLEKLISLMESNHCAPFLKQFFKEPLDMEEQEQQDNRKKAKKDDEEVKRYEWLYLITGENPSKAMENGSNANSSLKKKDSLQENASQIKTNSSLIEKQTSWFSPEWSYVITGENLPEENKTIDLKLMHLLHKEKYTDALILLYDDKIINEAIGYLREDIPHLQEFSKGDKINDAKLLKEIRNHVVESIFREGGEFFSNCQQQYFKELIQMAEFMLG